MFSSGDARENSLIISVTQIVIRDCSLILFRGVVLED